MNATKFFRYLWRVNAVLILVTALMASGLLGMLVYDLLGGGRRAAEQAVEVDPEPEAEPVPPSLGRFDVVRGAPVLRAPLDFGTRFRHVKFSASGDTYSTRNYLFLDLESMASRWLFPDNRQLVVDSDELHAPFAGDESGTGELRVIAFSYLVADADTDGDGQLTPEDRKTLAYSRPDGSGLTGVISGIDHILGTESSEDGTKHVVAWEAGGRWFTAVVSLRTFEIERQGEIPVGAG